MGPSPGAPPPRRVRGPRVGTAWAQSGEPTGPNLAPGFYCTQYHESDSKFTTLGIIKNRCFLQNNSSGSSISSDNLNCGNGVVGNPGAPWPPAWVISAGSGYNPNEILGQPGRSVEMRHNAERGPAGPTCYLAQTSGEKRGIAPELVDQKAFYPVSLGSL